MEEILFPEWDQLAPSYAVMDPLWSDDVELCFLDDPFDIERCQSHVRNASLGDGGPTGGVATIYDEQRFLIGC